MASAHTDFWEGRWERQETGWDIGRPYTPLARMIAAGEIPTGRALVPGCGRGHDVASLAAPDRHAVGLDFAPTAVAEARAHTATAYPDKAPFLEFAAADFFTYAPEQPFDVVFECVAGQCGRCHPAGVVPDTTARTSHTTSSLLPRCSYTFLCAIPPTR
jgi:methyl halide transferase